MESLTSYLKLALLVSLFAGSCYVIYYFVKKFLDATLERTAKMWVENNYLGVIRAAMLHDDSYDPWVSFVRKASAHVVSIRFKVSSEFSAPHFSQSRFNTVGYHLANSLDSIADIRLRKMVVKLLAENTSAKNFTQQIRFPISFNFKDIESINYSSQSLTATDDSRNFKVDRDYMIDNRVDFNAKLASW